jgi:hypothetical protein
MKIFFNLFKYLVNFYIRNSPSVKMYASANLCASHNLDNPNIFDTLYAKHYRKLFVHKIINEKQSNHKKKLRIVL